MVDLNFTFQSASVTKSGCNSLRVSVTLNPILPEFAEAHLLSVVALHHENISSVTENYDHLTGTITIDADYTGDISTRTVTLLSALGASTLPYDPLIPAVYYSEEECRGADVVQKLLYGFTYTSYGVLLISLLTKKIVGLELFGVLQLAYFDLADHDFLHLYLAPLAEFKLFNGLNLD